METPKDAGAKAVHLSNGDDHVVGVMRLKVLLSQEDDSWFAQGLEIDYAASGTSEDDVKKRFQEGLGKTIEANLQLKGNIESFLKVAPQSEWDRFYKTVSKTGTQQLFSSVQFCHVTRESKPIPFPYSVLEFVSSRAKPPAALQPA